MARITYITNTASPIRIVRLETVSRKVRASPCRPPCTPGGRISFAASSDELRGLADGVAGLQIEENRHAGELVDVVDRLRPEHRVPAGHGAQRNHALPVVALDVQQIQVLGSERSASATSRITWYWSLGFLIR